VAKSPVEVIEQAGTDSPDTVAHRAPAKVAMNPLDIKAVDFDRALTRRKKNREALLDWVRDSLVSGVDFLRIKIKGRWSKPFLTKAGSEKILGMLAVTPTFPDLREQLGKLQDGATMIVLTCELVDTHGNVVGTGAGGRSMEQDKFDLNRCIKMAEKSAQVDATLRLGGLSELFTQDEESAHDDVIDRPITPAQVEELTKLAEEVELPLQNICKFYGIKSLSELPAQSYLRAKKAITKKVKHDEEGDGHND
jgi:hypothetical protein